MSKVNQLIAKTTKDVAELRQSNDRDEDDSDSECEEVTHTDTSESRQA